MRKLLLVAMLVLAAVPSVALAAKPPSPGPQAASQSAPRVLYTLKGASTAYSNPGVVTIHVAGANHYRTALNGNDLTLSVDPSTKIRVAGGASVTIGHKGIVKVRAAKTIATTDLVTTLQAQRHSR